MVSRKQVIIASSLIAVSGITAVILLTAVGALPTAFEAESGTESTNAVQVADTSASNGSAVKFQAAQAQTGACPTDKRTVTASEVTNRLNSGYSAGTQLFVPGAPDPWGGCFPNAGNTGVPSGTTLTAYSGPCSISTSNTVVDGKNINCDLTITGANVTIRNSKIVAGNINVDSGSLALTDVEINFGNDINTEGLKGSNITVTRANMYAGKRQIWCNDCTLQDSFLHDQLSDPSGITHESAARIDQGSTYIHNTLLCNAPNIDPDAGCSANQTGYPDFAPVKNIRLEKNLYMATTGGYCSYGGATAGKPYSGDATNATNVKSIDNVFQRGNAPNDKTTIALTDKRRYTCGFYGVTTAYNSSKTGFQFTGNRWDDGLLFANDTAYAYGSFYD